MDEDLKLLAQYKTEVEQRLKKMPPVFVELSPLQSLATVLMIQTVARNLTYPLLAPAVEAGERIQRSFNRQTPIYKILVRGWGNPSLVHEAYKVLLEVLRVEVSEWFTKFSNSKLEENSCPITLINELDEVERKLHFVTIKNRSLIESVLGLDGIKIKNSLRNLQETLTLLRLMEENGYFDVERGG